MEETTVILDGATAMELMEAAESTVSWAFDLKSASLGGGVVLIIGGLCYLVKKQSDKKKAKKAEESVVADGEWHATDE